MRDLRESIPSWRLKEEADKRREIEARCAWLERENAVLRAAVAELGGDIEAITQRGCN